MLHKQAKVWQSILFLTIHAQYETNSILDTAPGRVLKTLRYFFKGFHGLRKWREKLWRVRREF